MDPNKKNLVISTGAGISAESGMMTYRDAGGLWDNYPVMQVASAEGFAEDPVLSYISSIATCAPRWRKALSQMPRTRAWLS